MRIFHFMRYKWWFLGSLSAVTIFAIIAVFVVGLQFGIEFKGGTRVEVALTKAASVNDVRSIVSGIGIKDPVVQTVNGPSGTTSYLITAKEMTQTQATSVVSQLDAKYGAKEGAQGLDVVGPSFGRATTNRAFIAIAIAVVAIIGYLSFRFEFKFAIPAIVALIHDVGLTLGLYAATGKLVTTSTVAAILTILGFSVHDTIIVFDRIRENTNTMKKETYGDMVDLSIRQTMVRSINTAIALLLPLVAILIFGGPTLKDFAFALTIGTASGAYSSFFVASPLLTIWKEREPRYRKRLIAAAAGGGGVLLTASAMSSAPEVGTSGGIDSSARGKSPKTVPAKGPQPRVSAVPKKGKSSKRPPGKGPKRTSR